MRLGFIARDREEDYRFAAEHGFPCVEYFAYPDIFGVYGEAVGRAGAYAKRYGIDLSCLGIFGDPDHISEDGEKRNRTHAFVRSVIEQCSRLEAPVMVVGMGEPLAAGFLPSLERAVDVLGGYIEYGKRLGVQIALYNCEWINFAHSPEAWSVLLSDLPDLGIKYDPTHPYLRGRDYLQEVKDWGSYIRHFHAKGVIKVEGRFFEEAPAGMDDIRWGPLLSILHHHNYTGDINLEPHSGPWFEEEKFHRGLLVSKRLIGPMTGDLA